MENDEIFRKYLRVDDVVQLFVVPPLSMSHLAASPSEILSFVNHNFVSLGVDLPFDHAKI